MNLLPDSFQLYNLRQLNRDRKWERRLQKNDEENEERNLRMKYGEKTVGRDWKKFKKERGLK